MYQSGAEDVGDLPFVDECRHLGFADGQPRAVPNLHVGDGIPAGEDALVGLVPLDDLDELLL